ncbi:MAG: GAF domain-containing sensor histidine kinase [Anaerolineae bacterium]|nr:GAF domain-containing sensor histidine kinase [Anaerolineae bacterium]
MNYVVITPEIITVFIASLVFGFLLIPASLRLRSKEQVVFHLLLYMALGLLLSLLHLVNLLNLITFPGTLYILLRGLGELTMILTFGGLTLNLLRRKQKGLLWYWVVALMFLLTWGLFAFNPLNWGNGATFFLLSQTGLDLYQIAPPAFIVTGSAWTYALGVPLIALILDLRKRQPTQYLNKLRFWLIAIIFLTTAGLVSVINPAFYWIGFSLLVIGSVLAGYTALSYSTPDLAKLFGRTLRYVLVLVVLFTIIFLALTAAIVITRNHTYYYPTSILLWLAALVAVLLAIILPPLGGFLNRFLTRIIFGKHRRDQKQIITHYSRNISSVLDMNRLGDTIINLMIETLGIEQGIVFVNERGGGGNVSLRPLSSVGMKDLTNGRFASDSTFIAHLRKKEKVLSQYDIDVLPEFRHIAEDEKKWLSSLGMELYVPILRERELVGMLAFGPQPQGTTYYDEDIDLMIALASQAALAIDSARLFEQLSLINREVGELTNQLAGLDQDKSDFLSIASHELRTPLTHIHGYSRMLLDLTEEELQDPTYVKTIIDGIAKGSDRMKDVVDLMFDVTEAHAGDINLFLGPVILEEVIDQAVRPYLPALDERRIAFQKANLKELPVIEADGTRLMQAFENLIGNAIKYTPNGGMITVEGQAIVMDEIGPAVEIVVADTGIGIDPKYHERIFEKFFRVDDTAHHSTGKTKFRGAGPGLGLTLVRGIAEAHGGKVWVESLGYDEVNCPGSKFFFVTPLHSSSTQKMTQAEIQTRHWRRHNERDEASETTHHG